MSVITIDMEKPCTRCGQMGAMYGGECLECRTEELSHMKANGGSAALMSNALIKGLSQIDKLAISYATKIHRAYLMSDDNLKVNFSIDLSSEKPGKIDVKTSITFIESKVKDEANTFVVEGQEEMNI